MWIVNFIQFWPHVKSKLLLFQVYFRLSSGFISSGIKPDPPSNSSKIYGVQSVYAISCLWRIAKGETLIAVSCGDVVGT